MKVKKSDIKITEKSVKREAKISDFDDLIFENRNKEYGAYQLRKKYNSVLLAGLIIASLLGTSAVMIPFLMRPKTERILSAGRGGVMIHMENFSQPEEQIYVPPAAPPPESDPAIVNATGLRWKFLATGRIVIQH